MTTMQTQRNMTRRVFYAKLTDEELAILDTIVEKLDYENRTEFITALIYSALYGEKLSGNMPEIEAIADGITRIEMLEGIFFAVLDEYAFPVIARYGPDKAYQILADDLADWMYTRCRTVPPRDQMKKWLHIFYATRRNRIIAYKTQLMTDNYKEEHGIEEPAGGDND